MEKKQLQLIKAALPKNRTVIPIIENVLIADDFITVTDLEVTLNIPYKYSDVPVCVSAVRFINAMETMPEGKITSQRMDENTDKVTLTHGTKKIGLTGDNHKNYPKTPPPLPGTTTPGLKHIGYLGAETLKHMNIALTFVSKDDLRPSMTGIYFNEKTIASTDAHRMYWWNKIPKLNAEFIMPAKAAKLLLQAGGGYEVYFRPEINTKDEKDADGKVIKPGKHIRSLCTMVRTDGLVISFYPIDARYPDYKVVIPKVTPETGYFLLNKKELVKELGTAIKYANTCTHQIVFSLNGKTTIHSEDIDLGHEYDSELQAEIKGDNIKFAINGKFLSEVAAMSETDTIKINYFTPTKAFIVNDSFLIMPLMLND